MARRAIREFSNLILRHQALAEFELIGRRDVVDTEHRLARTHVLFRPAVAIEAPFHLERLFLIHQRHPIDLTVAGGAADAFVDVNTVVEIDEVRQIMHASPLNRSSRAEAVANRLEKWARREDL